MVFVGQRVERRKIFDNHHAGTVVTIGLAERFAHSPLDQQLSGQQVCQIFLDRA